ncbi:unnamed protein product, partial [Allacma fusca]
FQAIAVVSLFSLSVVFGVFALLALEEPFYTEEAKPLLIASTIFFISIYILLLFQLLTGILLLKSLTLMKINLLGAVKTSWIWLITTESTEHGFCPEIYPWGLCHCSETKVKIIQHPHIICYGEMGEDKCAICSLHKCVPKPHIHISLNVEANVYVICERRS